MPVRKTPIRKPRKVEAKSPGITNSELLKLASKKRPPQSWYDEDVDAGLKLDHLVTTHSLSDLSAPFREAFGKTDENALGELVESMRKKHSRTLSK